MRVIPGSSLRASTLSSTPYSNFHLNVDDPDSLDVDDFTSTMSKAVETSVSLPLAEFLNTLPSPLVTALVGLAPHIARVRRAAQVLSWKTTWEDSWIALGALWAVCLFAEVGMRYMLPLLVASVPVYASWRQKMNPGPQLATEDSLQQTISDLTTIHALLPAVSLPATLPPTKALLRVLAISYVPYLLLTFCVPVRILLALAGTILLTWRARWTVLIRRGLWRSAHVRWVVYRSWGILSGRPLSTGLASLQASMSASAAAVADPQAEQPAQAVRFLFTAYENQRWWMGLDWTAALLPGERPSWCSASLQPVQPPAAFALPAPTTVYMRNSDGSRVKRTARWRWAEPEWRVVVHKEGEPAARVERPLPKEEPPGTTASSAARMLRAAGKMREGSVGGSPERPKVKEKESDEGEHQGRAEEEDQEEEVFTDPDGWVYADNKWEGPSAKGGMGKYTRYRRWTRIAILIETVDPAEPGETGIQRDDDGEYVPGAPSVGLSPVNVTVGPDWEPAHGRPDSLDKKPPAAAPADDEKDGLRKRLKAAVQSAGASS
ncbi:integral peroxisomal membrane peroxin-domain-containing protein [Rhodofomes roseus]|uniref:Integral peroxisomal membrane peroxin-domain-containing protein n=1 Tax=Rhodofomes roseus TaxID=34475 RepID=A0ABQ8K1U3_9APHY|nr:integral peroxisomal membrane peroxin-domain-containing protein [Rhodofomes roseus]KAH9830736.1 integral peroxisomal membrane peroxin-domain-containing protein [Rhodofomes roseus]